MASASENSVALFLSTRSEQTERTPAGVCKIDELERPQCMTNHLTRLATRAARRCSLLTTVLLTAAISLSAQSTKGYGRIVGTISDSSVGPVSGLRIYGMNGGQFGIVTDADGRFSIDSVMSGNGSLLVQGREYSTMIHAPVSAGKTTRQDFWIRPRGYVSPEEKLLTTDSGSTGAFANADTAHTVAYVDFGMHLLQAVARGKPDSNLFLSPASAAFALAMTTGGAGGATLSEMTRVLGVDRAGQQELRDMNARELESLANQRGVRLEIASSLWAAQGLPFLPTFLDQARKSYRADVHSLVLHGTAPMEQINRWVATATHDRISSILSDTLPDTASMVLLNAIYFKGKWLDPFDSAATIEKSFTTSKGRREARRFMDRSDEIGYAADSGMQIVRLPYQGGRIAMYVVLPDSGIKVSNVVTRLSARRWGKWMKALSKRDVHLQLPRFRLELSADFSGPLESMGMTRAFDCRRADFTKLLPGDYSRVHPVCVSKVAQRTFVEVNEVGTEAAAVTMVGMLSPTALVVRPPPIEFIVDRPFLVVIRDDRTGLQLFLGQITDPVQP